MALLIDANYTVIIVGGAGSCGFKVCFQGCPLLMLTPKRKRFGWI